MYVFDQIRLLWTFPFAYLLLPKEKLKFEKLQLLYHNYHYCTGIKRTLVPIWDKREMRALKTRSNLKHSTQHESILNALLTEWMSHTTGDRFPTQTTLLIPSISSTEQRINRGSKPSNLLEKINGWRSQRGGMSESMKILSTVV